jgi:PAS domain S-box-containing protein
MLEPPAPMRPMWRPNRWTAALLISVAWMVVIALAVAKLRQREGILVALAGLLAAVLTCGILAWSEHARWRAPLQALAHLTRALRQERKAGQALTLPPVPELAELTREIAALSRRLKARASQEQPAAQPPAAGASSDQSPPHSVAAMTRSGLYDAPPDTGEYMSAHTSGEFSTTDMVNRLDPIGFRWIESSPAEQEFLGWGIADLKQKSFLDIVHADDRSRAAATLRDALERGEALGQIVRVRTAQGKIRDVEVNVGARYEKIPIVSHLRCHLTDVTDKVQAERELRMRTHELTRANEQLRRINRELVELKDRYTDLYQNSPAMYFSLDTQGKVIECNQTMLNTLNLSREEIVGHAYDKLLEGPRVPGFLERYQAFMAKGSVEKETCWVKPSGELIDVWVIGKVVTSSKGSVEHSRFVAQDITVNRLLEAELQEKNMRLGEANLELSERNRELDEFVYVVSHDLQEPLRTLIAFSGFLQKDYGDKLETEGQEFVRYLVDASRRMRSMIQGLLHLSRAGKVIGEFAMVDLDELVAVIKTDLAELFRSKGAELRIKHPLPCVWGDRDRIAQLLANLLSNGVKYNQSPNPFVEIEATTFSGADRPEDAFEDQVDPYILITIKDNGIGIEPDFHKTIFQLFRRLHTRDEYEGTGVGLSICNKIVQAHGGRIWVESTPGVGSTFFVQLRSGPSSASSRALSSFASGALSPVHENSVSEVDPDEYPTI